MVVTDVLRVLLKALGVKVVRPGQLGVLVVASIYVHVTRVGNLTTAALKWGARVYTNHSRSRHLEGEDDQEHLEPIRSPIHEVPVEEHHVLIRGLADCRQDLVQVIE